MFLKGVSIKLSSANSLITRTIKINGGPYAVKSVRNTWRYVHFESFRSEFDLHCIFFSFVFRGIIRREVGG